MHFAPRRPSHRFGRLSSIGSWAAPALVGWVLTGGFGATSSAGEVQDSPTQLPSASHDSAAPPKARLASTSNDSKAASRTLDGSSAVRGSTGRVEADPIARARQVVADCKARYETVEDYTCTFFKRERIDGSLYTPHVMTVKARTKPTSLYFKFLQPYAGREAIYVQGQNHGKIVAHDVGLARVVAGTMHLDPKGDMAMEENRHPVTEAGLGAMIDTVKARWDSELHPGESIVLFHPNARVSERPCLMVETIHPKPGPGFLFHKVKFYVDKELGLPVRFEAYDWPKSTGVEPELMEEYTYTNLRLNVGLKDRDFDPANKQYSYGRF
jgi:outer membrane lipoprotein-sorting protein